jgi:hypothetical protein
MGKRLVHLDHLITRDDIYYHPRKTTFTDDRSVKKDEIIRYIDIRDNRGTFSSLRKPDFQRQTNAWDPDKCVEFLDSIVQAWLIPHIILWKQPGSKNRYVIDGAHRISVVKAWMCDDWGDSPRAKKYYTRQNQEEIEKIAEYTRDLVERTIGNFKELQSELSVFDDLSDMDKMSIPEHKRAILQFFHFIEDDGLPIHWADDKSYEQVAQSFVRINRGGQPLGDFEVYLIENRKSSYVRSIMAIAGAGKGEYWPPTQEIQQSRELRQLLETFPEKAADIHERLFKPSYQLPPNDVHQPFMPAPPYFRKHLYLRELLPILVNNDIVKTKSGFEKLVKREQYNLSIPIVIKSSDNILSTIEGKLKHVTSLSNREPLSLDIVPLFYWYNKRGQFVRALCYGFLYWIFTGTDEDIRNRKIIFSGNRERFEYILHTLKTEIASIHFTGGAALHTTIKTAKFFQELLMLLHTSRDKPTDELIDHVNMLLEGISNRDAAAMPLVSSKRRSGRNTAIDTHSKIDLLFNDNTRCHICGGHIDLKRYHQMDHVQQYKEQRETSPQNLLPTHQFCNNNRDIISTYKAGNVTLSPVLSSEIESEQLEEKWEQMSFEIEDKWEDEQEFPDAEIDLE